MTTRKTTTTSALTAAREASNTADAAVDTAEAEVERTAHAIQAAEAHVVDTLTDLNAGKADVTQDTITQARATVEQAHRDHEWALLQRDAAHAARSRAHDEEARAHRALTAQEYLAAHKEFNDPASREAILHERIRADVAELVSLVDERQEHHDRLARDIASWPADERPTVPAGKAIQTYGQRGFGAWSVMVPKNDVAETLTAALADAAERERAEVQARANN